MLYRGLSYDGHAWNIVDLVQGLIKETLRQKNLWTLRLGPLKGIPWISSNRRVARFVLVILLLVEVCAYHYILGRNYYVGWLPLPYSRIILVLRRRLVLLRYARLFLRVEMGCWLLQIESIHVIVLLITLGLYHVDDLAVT